MSTDQAEATESARRTEQVPKEISTLVLNLLGVRMFRSSEIEHAWGTNKFERCYDDAFGRGRTVVAIMAGKVHCVVTDVEEISRAWRKSFHSAADVVSLPTVLWMLLRNRVRVVQLDAA